MNRMPQKPSAKNQHRKIETFEGFNIFNTTHIDKR